MNGQITRQDMKIVMLLLLMAMTSLSPTQAHAVDDWQVAGEHGKLSVQGSFLEGACQLKMGSVFQQVDLGELNLNQFTRVGERGQPVTFVIVLENCARSGGEQRDEYTGNTTSDVIAPVVTLTFNGVVDPEFPSILKTVGAGGIGLQITDPNGHIVHPGIRGEPVMITPGNNQLAYTVTPVRTPAPLIAGSFKAITNFEVGYD